MDVAASVEVLERDEWEPRAHEHARRVDALTCAHRERAAHGVRHPVEDFLYEYYPTRPGVLRRWHPGWGIALRTPSAFDGDPAYARRPTPVGDVVTVDVAAFARRRAGLAWAEGIVRRSAQRPPQLGCFGLHEWAMVYGLGPDEVRHHGWPLRVAPEQVQATVDRLGLRCTHFDAFRVFTPEAVARNERQPTRGTQPDLDQPGCLHATMDLYKWSSKFAALVGSDLVLACFELALEARTLDMQAAPYELSALGLTAVAVETTEGRAEYAARQRGLMARAAPLRRQLASTLAGALSAIDAASTGPQPAGTEDLVGSGHG